LRTHVYELAGNIGEHNVFHPDALHAVEAYITNEWQQQGYTVHKQTYTARGIECANLEITCTGNNRNNDVILIAAHYDSVLGSPGANDNGSGVAALLELSRLFKEVPPETSLRFVAFVNEEPPFLLAQHGQHGLCQSRQGTWRFDTFYDLAGDHRLLSEPARQSKLPAFTEVFLSRYR
jgi:acetylornithine deacetylase/succinyl-diaminopimelate desuccinylase-like protein